MITAVRIKRFFMIFRETSRAVVLQAYNATSSAYFRGAEDSHLQIELCLPPIECWLGQRCTTACESH